MPHYFRGVCFCGDDAKYGDTIVKTNDKVEVGIKEEYTLVNRIQNRAMVERTRQLEEQARTLQDKIGTIADLEERIRTLEEENGFLMENVMAYRFLQFDA